jgi:drug/metabolite transporter (DMT)-like permease
VLASTTAATSISPALIIGAGFLLLGSVLMMTAPLSFYDAKEGRKDEMERWGRIFPFVGAVAVLYGTVEELGSGANVVALIVLFLVALVMAVLLFVPFVSWLRALRKQPVSRLQGCVKHRTVEEEPHGEDNNQETTITDGGRTD